MKKRLFVLLVVVGLLLVACGGAESVRPTPVIADVLCEYNIEVTPSLRGSEKPLGSFTSSVGLQSKANKMIWKYVAFAEFQEKNVAWFQKEVGKLNDGFLQQIGWKGEAFSLNNADGIGRILKSEAKDWELFYESCPKEGYFYKKFDVFPAALSSPSGLVTLTQTTVRGDNVWFEAKSASSWVKFSVPMSKLYTMSTFPIFSFRASDMNMNAYSEARATKLSERYTEVAIFSIDSSDEAARDLYLLLQSVSDFYPVESVDTSNLNGKSVVHIGSLITK